MLQTALQVPLLTNEIPLAHMLVPFGTLVLVQAQVLLLMLRVNVNSLQAQVLQNHTTRARFVAKLVILPLTASIGWILLTRDDIRLKNLLLWLPFINPPCHNPGIQTLEPLTMLPPT